MAEPMMIYKIAILELLNKSGFPLSNSQISDFFLEGDLTDYFTAQQSISDVEQLGYITSTTTHNNTTYSITLEGKKTLELFRDKLTPAIISDIAKYMSTNAMIMREENSYRANYFKADRGGYVVQCKILNEDNTTLDITLHVSNKEQAESICNNWRVKCEDVYIGIIDTLIQ